MDNSTQTEANINSDIINLNGTLIIRERPIDKFHVTNKEYVDENIKNTDEKIKHVDEKIKSIKWERDVTNFHDPKKGLPKNPKKGDNYISVGTGNGWLINNIYEFTGTDNNWNEIIPKKGYIVWIQYDKGQTYIYNGIAWEMFGKTIDHTNLKNIGSYSHRDIDEHIKNKISHLTEGNISHTRIRDTGTFSHSAIDKHIQNSTNAHFGQKLSKDGTPEFRSVRISEAIMASHAVPKSYVDSKIQGVEWERPTKCLFDPKSGIPDACIGDRYICIADAKDWIKNYIYEYDGVSWKGIMPTKDYATFVEGGNMYNNDTIVFNGNEWIKFGSVGDHECLNNIGTFNHFEIDKHLVDTEHAHFNQDLKETASPSFSNLHIAWDLFSETSNVKKQNVESRLCVGETIVASSLMQNDFAIIKNNDNVNAEFICANGLSNEPINLTFKKARGDVYNPTSLLSGTSIGAIVYSGHDNTEFFPTCSIKCITTEDYTESKHGSEIEINTTTNGCSEPTTKMKIENDGTIECLCTNDCISGFGGGLIVHGGINVTKNATIHENLSVRKNLYFDNDDEMTAILNNTMSGFDCKMINICGGGERNNNRGGNIIVSGVNSIIDGSVQINAGYPFGEIEMTTGNIKRFIIKKNGNCQINNTDNTTSNSSGSLVIKGGLCVKKDLFIDGSKIIFGSENGISTQPIICPNSIETKDSSTLTLCGGGRDNSKRGAFVKVNGNEHNSNNADGGSVYITTGDVDTGRICFTTGKNYQSCVIDHNGIFNILSTTDASDSLTGSLIVNGGMSIKKKLMTNSLVCNKMFRLPSISIEQDENEIGMMYYDVTRDCVRVYTKHGWRNLAFK